MTQESPLLAESLPRSRVVPLDAGTRLSRPGLVARWAELIIGFVLLPFLIVMRIIPWQLTMPLLLAGTLWALAVVLRSGPPRFTLGLGATGRRNFLPALASGTAIWAACLTAGILIHQLTGRPWFPLPSRSPQLFLLIAAVYSLSAASQEFLFRGYFFWRFRGIAPPTPLAAINVAVFAWVHIVFGSWLSVALTAVGGAIFTALYLRRPSLLAVTLVHLLFGMSLFAMDYGRHFYHGSSAVAAAFEPGR